MALANVAWILALDGKRVLTIDWDLEAPGLHRYFLPFLDDPELVNTQGLIDLFWSYTDLVLSPKESWPPGIENPLAFADAQRYAVPLHFPYPHPDACIHFLGAGCQEATYATRVRNFDWTAFYGRLGGGDFIEKLRERFLDQYDFVLIDSRTGVADTSGICTIEIPDAVVLCFTYNRQSMKGVEAVAKSIRVQRGESVQLFPVAMRADRSVKGYDEAKNVARELLEPFMVSQFATDALDQYWQAAEVPHYSDFSFQETLAIFKDLPNQRNTLLNDMVWLTETVRGIEPGSLTVPDLGDEIRDRYSRRFALRDPRHSQLLELLELQPSEAYSRLSNLISANTDDPSDHAWIISVAKTLDVLADRMHDQGLVEQSIAATRENIAMLRVISTGNELAQRLLANNLGKLAAQLEMFGRFPEALGAIKETIESYELMVPNSPEVASNLANAYGKFGTLLGVMGRWPEAIEITNQAVELYERLAAKSPGVFERDLAGCLTSLGSAYMTVEQFPIAVELIQRATDLYEQLWKNNHDASAPDLARSLSNLARAYEASELNQAALAAVLRAAVVYEGLARKAPNLFKPNLPMGLSGREMKYQELDLSGKRLNFLPEAITQLQQLRHLDVSNNQLRTLPEFIGQLRDLQRLDVSKNQLRTLPDTLWTLTNLEVFSAARNRLDGLSDDIKRLTKLQSLDLSSNKISELSESIHNLTELRILLLSSNRLTALPDSIRELTQLRTLDVSANRLSSLPTSIGYLSQLRFLGAANNRFSALPQSLTHLRVLRTLDLSGNKLTALPVWLRELTLLDRLFLHGNDLLGLPTEVLGPNRKDVKGKQVATPNPANILEYYFRVRGGQIPLNEAKLIVLGRGGAGKTSIVNRLVRNTFQDQPTQGIEITNWTLRLNGSEDVQLHIWDFGGQEIMHATHQYFLTQRSLYLLVLNGRIGNEDADAEYWLKLIETFGGNSPVIVVLNKIGEYPFDVNRRVLQEKYSIREFVSTDCTDGTGIEQLKEAIKREIDRLEDLRKPFPSEWFAIKARLSSMKENYLTFEKYRRICEENGETNGKGQEDLAGFLHRLGIMLNYRDDPQLQKTLVLNPRWVTKGIYDIVGSSRLHSQNGELRFSDLPKILNNAEYPLNMHRFFVDLMKRFELCFTLPEDDNRFLIPEMLDRQEPTEVRQFRRDECLNFQYLYSVLPAGLLPRFIVRTHVLSGGCPRWRTGVILKLDNNSALVRADTVEQKVFVTVAGPVTGRRQLLALIRYEFDRIHHSIPNLQPEEMVPLPDHPDLVVPYKKLLAMERHGIRKFPEFARGQIVEIDAHALLNSVDLDARPDRPSAEQIEPPRIFVSYSHEDENFRDELLTYLKLLERRGVIETWHDRKIMPGTNWHHEIDANIERADIILLLVSADFVASDYCYDVEVKRALERADKQDVRLIPIIIRDVDWSSTPFAKFHSLPHNGRAITRWPERDSAWRDVIEGIEKAAEEVRKKSGST